MKPKGRAVTPGVSRAASDRSESEGGRRYTMDLTQITVKTDTFSQSCWNAILIHWNMNLSPLDMIIEARSNFGNLIFREIFITTCWVIWTSRNAVIFYNAQVDINVWKRHFNEELGQVCT